MSAPPNNAIVTQADRLKLPGMLPQETVIFKAWWAVHSTEYTNPQFNVRVGKGVDPGPSFDDGARRGAIANSQYRIDALLQKGSLYEIVEVKYRASPLPVGQLLSYQALWMFDNPGKGMPEMRLVCFQAEQDILYVCQQLFIAVDVQDADFSGLQMLKQ